jgi:hypothetical protein
MMREGFRCGIYIEALRVSTMSPHAKLDQRACGALQITRSIGGPLDHSGLAYLRRVGEKSVKHFPARFSHDTHSTFLRRLEILRIDVMPRNGSRRSAGQPVHSDLIAHQMGRSNTTTRGGAACPNRAFHRKRPLNHSGLTYLRRIRGRVSPMSPHTFLTMRNQSFRAGSKSSASTSYPEGSHRIASNATNPANGATAMIQKTFVPSAADSTGNRNSETVELERISV